MTDQSVSNWMPAMATRPSKQRKGSGGKPRGRSAGVLGSAPAPRGGVSVAAAPASVDASPRAQKTAATRHAIISAALDEFSVRGFAATRLDDVAERAGVAKGTIYVHFADKEALFQEIVRTMVVPLVMNLKAQPPDNVPTRAVIEHLITTFVREIYGTRRREIVRLIMTEGPHFPALAEFYYREVVERGVTGMRALMTRAAARGELPNDALIRFPHLMIAPLMLSIVWSGLFERFAPLDVPGLAKAHLDLIFGKEGAS